MIFVMETLGTKEIVTQAVVHIFSNTEKANEYIKLVTTGDTEFWVKAKIIQIGETVNLQN
jgi:hypothetical protein